MKNCTKEIKKLPIEPDQGRKGEGGQRTHGLFKKSGEGLPLITVITIAYNSARYLEKTIKSALSQSYDNVEYIVIDGGSTDESIDILKRYDSEIDYWVSEPDQGISDAFNKGIRLAAGDWLNFLNAGDSYISERTLSDVAMHFDKKDIITGFSRAGRGRCPRRPKRNSQPLHVKSRLSHQASFINRKVFLKKCSFSTDFKIRMDYDFWMRVLKGYEFLFINDFLVSFDNTGISGSARERFYQEELFINAQHLKNHTFVNLMVKGRYYLEKLLGRDIIVKLLELIG